MVHRHPMCFLSLTKTLCDTWHDCIESLRFSIDITMSSAYRDSFITVPNLYDLTFFFLSFLPWWMTRISSAVLNRNNESRHFTVKYNVSCRIFVDTLSQIDPSWSWISSDPSWLRIFVINRCWILSKAFSAFIEMIAIFPLFCSYGKWPLFYILYQTFIPKTEPTWL